MMKRFAFYLFCLLASPISEAMEFCYEDQAYEPYLADPQQAGSTSPGILIELLLYASRDAGIPLTLKRMPWRRCLSMLESGLIDGAFAVIWTEERETLFAYPKNTRGELDDARYFWRVSYPVFTHDQSTLNWDGEKFTGVTYGLSAPPGYVAYNKLKNQGVLYPTDLVPKSGLRLLSLGRLDGYVVEQFIGERMVKRQSLKHIKTPFKHAFMQSDWYLPISKQLFTTQPALVNQFWDALATARMHYQEALIAKYRLSAANE